MAIVTVLAAGQAQVDDAPEGHNANQPAGHASRENNSDPIARTAAGSEVLVDGRRIADGVRRESIPGGHDEVALAGKRTGDGKEGEASANESSIPGESSLPTTIVVSAGAAAAIAAAVSAGSGSVGVGSRSKGGQREVTTAAAKVVFQGPKRVAGFPMEGNGGRVSGGVRGKALVDPVGGDDDPPLLLPQPQRRKSAGAGRNGSGTNPRQRDRRRGSEPPPTTSFSRGGLSAMEGDPVAANTADIPPAAFDCLPYRGDRYHSSFSSKNVRPATAKAVAVGKPIPGKGVLDGGEQQQLGFRPRKKTPSGEGEEAGAEAAGTTELCRPRSPSGSCTTRGVLEAGRSEVGFSSGSKGDDGSVGTDGRKARSSGSGHGVAVDTVVGSAGGGREGAMRTRNNKSTRVRELAASFDAGCSYGRVPLVDGGSSSERSHVRATTVCVGMPAKQLDISADASDDFSAVDAIVSAEDSSAVRAGSAALPVKIPSWGEGDPGGGSVSGGIPPAGDGKKGQVIEVPDSVTTGSTLSLSGPATNERSPSESARDDIPGEKKRPLSSPSSSSLARSAREPAAVDTREGGFSDNADCGFLLQRRRPNAIAIAIGGASYDASEKSSLAEPEGSSPGAGAGAGVDSSENGSRFPRQEGGEDPRMSVGHGDGEEVAAGDRNGGSVEGKGNGEAPGKRPVNGSGGGHDKGQQKEHHGGSSAAVIAVVGVGRSGVSSSGGGSGTGNGEKEEGERDTLDGEEDLQEEAESSEDEEFNSSVQTDHFGFFITSERRGLDVPPEVARVRRLKEWKRSDKWRTMMASFDQWRRGRKGKRFRKRVRKGLPDCVRGKVWQMMSGSLALMEKEPDMYADLVASDLPVDGPIEEDIPRTMYDHEMFCRKSRVDGRSMLRRVLTAYGRYDREVQYCQGINYICALFLLYMPEENAFWLLVASMNRERAPLRDLFLPGMVKAQEFQFVVDSLTDKYCHELSTQILAYNLTPAMYATQWFLTAFTQRFPYEFVTRVWDIFLLEDWKVFYRMCLALFKSVEDQAVKLDLENMNLLLRNMPPRVNAEEILTIATSIPLKHKHIEKRVAAFYRDVAPGLPDDGK